MEGPAPHPLDRSVGPGVLMAPHLSLHPRPAGQAEQEGQRGDSLNIPDRDAQGPSKW